MPNTKALQLSFNAGEVSEEMYGRFDQKAHQSGLRKCRNMYIKPQGAAKRRPGLQYVDDARSNSLKSRMIPFFSTPHMMLELTQNHVRFYRNGAQIALTGDNYFVARACTVNTSTGVWTLTTGNLDNLPNDAQITIYGLTAANVGALYTDVSQGPAQVSLIANVGEWQWNAKGSSFTTTAPHGLRSNDAVIMRESGSSLRWFYVDVISSTEFRYRVGSQVSPAYTGTQPTWATSNLTIFKAVTPASFIGVNSLYYIDKLSSTTFKLKETAGGSSINSYSSAGTNNFTVAAYYAQGSLRFDEGLANYYQTNSATFSSSSSTDNWVNYGINVNSPTVWALVAPASGLAHNNNYSDSELMELTYAQDLNVLTITHRSRPTLILKRTTDLQWSWEYASYTPPMAAPTGLAATPFGAIRYRIEQVGQFGGATSPRSFANASANAETYPFVPGDTVKCFTGSNSGTPANLHARVQNQVFTIAKITRINSSPQTDCFEIKANSQTNLGLAGLGVGEILDVPAASTINPPLLFELWPDDSQSTNTYVVTAVDEEGVESQPSAQVSVENNLYARETYNVLTWTQVPNPVGGSPIRRYNIYKRTNGLFGWIGQTDTAASVTFRDDNITPDVSKTVPILDTTLTQTADNYASAVGYFEQRKVLANTNKAANKLWMTRSNTDQDLSFSIPIKDSDRISLSIRARENHKIRHIVNAGELLLLTDQGEWRVTAINSEAVTPSTVAVRPQSYIGSSFVTPALVSNALLFCAARGGHVHQLAFNFNAQGYTTADLSLRALHLFDDKTLADLALMRSPLSIAWFVSSSGGLLGLTYAPEEEITAWHQHDTDGVFESVACIQEGQVDSMYCVVRRQTNGVTCRYIERLTDVLATGDSSRYLDSSLDYDGTHTGGRQLIVTEFENGGWNEGALVTVTDSLIGSVFLNSDLNDVLEFRSGDQSYRGQVVQRISSSQARVRLLQALPAAMRNVAIATWAWARATFSGATNLAGRTVDVVADGIPYLGQQVDASGVLVLLTYATRVMVGIPYKSELETLPIAMQIDGLGQGRTKNVNKAWLRIAKEDAYYSVGPSESELVQEGELPTTETSLERQVTLLPAWSQDGSILVRQSNPSGLTVNGIVIEVAVGS